jgi:hypothetical protein
MVLPSWLWIESPPPSRTLGSRPARQAKDDFSAVAAGG